MQHVFPPKQNHQRKIITRGTSHTLAARAAICLGRMDNLRWYKLLHVCILGAEDCILVISAEPICPDPIRLFPSGPHQNGPRPYHPTTGGGLWGDVEPAIIHTYIDMCVFVVFLWIRNRVLGIHADMSIDKQRCVVVCYRFC